MMNEMKWYKILYYTKVFVIEKNFSKILSNFLKSLNDTRRNGQPPKSQLTKKSTCQKSQLAKNTKHIWLFYAQVDFLASSLFGQLTFWRLTISPSISLVYYINSQIF